MSLEECERKVIELCYISVVGVSRYIGKREAEIPQVDFVVCMLVLHSCKLIDDARVFEANTVRGLVIDVPRLQKFFQKDLKFPSLLR